MLAKSALSYDGAFFVCPVPCTQRVGFTQKNRLETVQAEGEGGKFMKKARRGKNWLVASSLLLCL